MTSAQMAYTNSNKDSLHLTLSNTTHLAFNTAIAAANTPLKNRNALILIK
ncbi:MAG: hypothetical protein ACAF41_02935 [Leptolyngbya sp. BL-A-14]